MNGEDLSLLVEVMIQMAILAGIVIIANLAIQRRELTPAVYSGIIVTNLFLLLFGFAILNDNGTTFDFENTDTGASIVFLTAGIATILLFENVRNGLRSFFPERVTIDESKSVSKNRQPLDNMQGEFLANYAMLSGGEVIRFGVPQLATSTGISVGTGGSPMATPTAGTHPQGNELLGYDPKSVVHTVALIMMVWAFGLQAALFVLGGGLSGIAEDININAVTLLANFIPQVGLGLLGVGFLTRRSWSGVLKRLGLEAPTINDVIIGVGGTFALLFTQFFLAIIWLSIVGMDTYESQTEASGAIAESVTTIWIAIGIATTAAIGEEIAFRGALQPIFGLWWTAAIFTVLHMQYTLTPAAGIIFAVAIGLGYMRRYASLYACIIAHFLYNFTLLLLALNG